MLREMTRFICVYVYCIHNVLLFALVLFIIVGRLNDLTCSLKRARMMLHCLCTWCKCMSTCLCERLWWSVIRTWRTERFCSVVAGSTTRRRRRHCSEPPRFLANSRSSPSRAKFSLSFRALARFIVGIAWGMPVWIRILERGGVSTCNSANSGSSN